VCSARYTRLGPPNVNGVPEYKDIQANLYAIANFPLFSGCEFLSSSKIREAPFSGHLWQWA
jgi:hypothetical protein